MYQGYSLFYRKPPPKFEIKALFRLVMLYTDTKTYIIVKSIHSSLRSESKMTEKRTFLRKTSFRPNRFFYMVVIQKLVTLNFQKFLTFFDVNKKNLDNQKNLKISNFYKICQNRENLQFLISYSYMIYTEPNIQQSVCLKFLVFLSLFFVSPDFFENCWKLLTFNLCSNALNVFNLISETPLKFFKKMYIDIE
ncbi:hypothetical protein AGLY_006799 [Aphis glycines]|uniref:Uncharacterized protein n=1 Tax=Aphis glycines TaxID=307491 RepID=A0A6G0TQS0_APHGL|nr:hypothetical protein AGLY_006799 [Aphis glycines]